MFKRLALVTTVVVAASVGASAPAGAAVKKHRKPLARAHAARLQCDGVRRSTFFYSGPCNKGIGSSGGFALDYYMLGWGQGPLLRAQFRQRGLPAWAVNGIMGQLHGATRANNKKAPYDWAKVARNDLIKAAAIKCLFSGALLAGLNVLWDLGFGSSNAMIERAARNGAIACAGKVGYDWGKAKILQKYHLEI